MKNEYSGDLIANSKSSNPRHCNFSLEISILNTLVIPPVSKCPRPCCVTSTVTMLYHTHTRVWTRTHTQAAQTPPRPRSLRARVCVCKWWMSRSFRLHTPVCRGPLVYVEDRLPVLDFKCLREPTINVFSIIWRSFELVLLMYETHTIFTQIVYPCVNISSGWRAWTSNVTASGHVKYKNFFLLVCKIRDTRWFSLILIQINNIFET